MSIAEGDSTFLMASGRAVPVPPAAVAYDYESPPDTDKPVRLRSFRRNVRRCKISLGAALSASLLSGLVHISRLPFPKRLNLEVLGGWIDAARWGADALIVLMTVSTHCHFGAG